MLLGTDALWLSFYPLAFIALGQFYRRQRESASYGGAAYAGNQLLGNRRLRESLKAAGVRIVVMVNGQESWTYIL